MSEVFEGLHGEAKRLAGPRSHSESRAGAIDQKDRRLGLRPTGDWVRYSSRLFVKRFFDVVLSAAGILFLAPVLLAIAIAIRIDSPGPAIYRQRRNGCNKTFMVLKFRTMRVSDANAAFVQATKQDPRLTRIGGLLRRTNLDELPQLFNVLIGDMSLVGPRPHAVEHDAQFLADLPRLMTRYSITPGITGWAQVNGLRGETNTTARMERRLEHDLWYIENWSLALDVKILFKTLFDAKSGTNAY